MNEAPDDWGDTVLNDPRDIEISEEAYERILARIKDKPMKDWGDGECQTMIYAWEAGYVAFTKTEIAQLEHRGFEI